MATSTTIAAAAAAATRRLRAFKRWMRSQNIDCSDALNLIDHAKEGISVRTLCDLHEGDLVATIPKHSCLTIKTSGARNLIETAGLEGYLGLSVALMYEKGLGHQSPWFGYLQLLPENECIPMLWSLEEVDSLLLGTELHKIVKEDKALVYEDWEECIQPLLSSAPVELNPDFFGVEQYLAAKSLIASRSFQIDDYYGFGMVPLADLFNHKTGAEDVHFTSISSHLAPEDDAEDNHESDEYESTDDSEDNHERDEYENIGDGEQLSQNSQSRKGASNGGNSECSSASGDDPTVLEMIIVKDVKSGAEVFNTYGVLGNAALLHRYGFTEVANTYDIVNIDLELVLQWSSSLFSGRHNRVRFSLWRRLDYSGCESQNSEYFEISSNGEPQVELLILLYIILLPDEAYQQLDLTVSMAGNLKESLTVILQKGGNIAMEKAPEMSKDLLLIESVSNALLSLANIRESFYGSNSLKDDIEALRKCCRIKERKLYHSLTLRVSERTILEKLRTYAAEAAQLSRAVKRGYTRKKLKST
ncbi:Ribosomal lysine N-methyltransferase 3 [Camellia lanceoleosa]|uniref:Ribosomal lysine N-methyltransferase 3 n=1 Tax=Camellia lanceoleosa TaxID=1840588 RepID=A0ACC0J1C0_9ERIC|nr:Ribosomal lysine N-methyltransferase 3 [Camellia lanceoleosa]